jgi:hypothetical protein
MRTAEITVNGTGISSPFFLDLNQNPFAVSVACVLGTAAGTFTVEHTFNSRTAYLPTWDGSTNVTWFPNSGITVATASISGNYAFPVVAVRLNVVSAVATTTVTMFLTQADNTP